MSLHLIKITFFLNLNKVIQYRAIVKIYNFLVLKLLYSPKFSKNLTLV